MSISNEITVLEAHLESVSTKLRDSQRVQTSIASNRDELFRSLATAVRSVETAFELVGGPQARIAQGGNDTELSGRQNLGRLKELRSRYNSLQKPFKEVSNLANMLLSLSMKSQLDAIDLEVEVDTIRDDVDAVSVELKLEVERATEKEQSKKNELESAEKGLEVLNKELRTLERKRNGINDDRKVLRVMRAVTWGFAPVIPIVAVPAGLILEAVAHDVREKRKAVMNKESTVFTSRNTLQPQIDTLCQERESLERAINEAKGLSHRCAELRGRIQARKIEAVEQTHVYQRIKEAAGDFSLWSDDIHIRFQFIDSGSMGTTETDLRLLMDSFEPVGKESAVRICQPLLSLPWETI